MDVIDHGGRTQPITEVGDGAPQMPDVDVPNGPHVSPPCPALAAAFFGARQPRHKPTRTANHQPISSC
jgi:hypothetical protein